VYDLEWSLKNYDDISYLLAVLNGDYDVNPNEEKPEIYFFDPFAAKRNVLPDMLASPWKSMFNGRNLMKGSVTSEDVVRSTGDTYPAHAVKIETNTLPATLESHEFFIPVPPFWYFHFGALGSSDLGSFGIKPAPSGVETSVSWLPDATTFLNTTVQAGADGGILVRYYGTDLETPGEVTLAGCMAVVTQDSSPPAVQRWTPGQGSSALAVFGEPALSGYSSELDLQALSVSLVEVGP